MSVPFPWRGLPGRTASFLRTLLLLVGLPVAAAGKLNVIVVLVDDLGWADLGCQGNRFHETPNLDRLAGEGMRFTDAYSACTVCSPTRASLLTGKYPARLGVTDWIAGHAAPKARLLPPDWVQRLDPREPTLASLLKVEGYSTAMVGKWHLGRETPPSAVGFDVNRGGDHRGQPPSYFSPYGLPELEDGPVGEYLTDRECDEALRFIEASRDRPFFLYLSHYAVHTPLQARPEQIEKYRAKQEVASGNPTYAAMLESVDVSLGRIRARLEELDLSGRTLIVFTSDNGGLVLGGDRRPTDNFPLRSGKGDLYEGGVRVPFLVHWPGVTRPGSTHSIPVHTVDIAPTVLEVALGSERAGSLSALDLMDGRSLVPLLRGAQRWDPRPLFWHYPHYHPGGATPYGAIRVGDWKLIQFDETGRVELYHLASDLGESMNLSRAMPDKALELSRLLSTWRTGVGAMMPRPNPDHAPASIRPREDGSFFLAGHAARTVGRRVQYESAPNKDTLGFWVDVEDHVQWDLEITRPGTYELELLIGCGTGSGGSEVRVTLGDSVLHFTVMETGGFQHFQARRVGRLILAEPGRHTLTIQPVTKPGVAVMDIREGHLRPIVR